MKHLFLFQQKCYFNIVHLPHMQQQQASPEERNTPALTPEGKDIDMETITPPPEAPVEVAQESSRMSRCCCTLEEFRSRPEIALWCIGNFLSFLGFYMSYISQVSGFALVLVFFPSILIFLL